jgi:hypothetical protein
MLIDDVKIYLELPQCIHPIGEIVHDTLGYMTPNLRSISNIGPKSMMVS